MHKSLKEIADLIGGVVKSQHENIIITGLENIEGALRGDLIFAVEPHIDDAKSSKASAVLLPLSVDDFPLPSVLVKDPRAAFAKLLDVFSPKISYSHSISDKAFIGNNVSIGSNVTIMPFAVIDDFVSIGDNSIIYSNVFIGHSASIGSHSIIFSNVTIREHCSIGNRCIIHPSSVIGSDGFGFTTDNDLHTKVPQVGIVSVDDDVEIGACVTIDRATIGSTFIGAGTKIDNLVHIGHNCKIGKNCLIVAQVGLSGSTIVGDNVTFGGQSASSGHLSIGSHSVFAARTGISKSLPDGSFCAGFPIQSHSDWLKSQAAIRQLPSLIKRIKSLESLLYNK